MKAAAVPRLAPQIDSLLERNYEKTSASIGSETRRACERQELWECLWM